MRKVLFPLSARNTLMRQLGPALTLAVLAACLSMGLSATAVYAACSDAPAPGVDWAGCDKSFTDLSGVDLSGADLTNANLSVATLKGADLTGTFLADAVLLGTDLTGAILDRIDLTGAVLRAAILTDATGIPSSILKAVWFFTECPDRSLSEDHKSSNDPDGTCDGHFLPLNANDADGDGVDDDLDACPDTPRLPEAVPTEHLGTNRFVDLNGDGVFDTTAPQGTGPQKSFTLEQTAGCSCEQIIEQLELGEGHVKYGCSISALEEWISLVNGTQ
jgi:hypothetical protein